MSNKAKQGKDFEDRLKVLVHQSVLNQRKAICNGCPNKGANNFCQVDYDYLPEKQLYKYNSCPAERWKEHWAAM